MNPFFAFIIGAEGGPGAVEDAVHVDVNSTTPFLVGEVPGVASRGASIPALLTRMSSLPYCSTARLTRASASRGLLVSMTMLTASPPISLISEMVLSAGWMSPMTILTPASARTWEMPRPMPLSRAGDYGDLAGNVGTCFP